MGIDLMAQLGWECEQRHLVLSFVVNRRLTWFVVDMVEKNNVSSVKYIRQARHVLRFVVT